MSGNRFQVLSLFLVGFWFCEAQPEIQKHVLGSDIPQDELKTLLVQLVKRLDHQERCNLQLEEKLQQQKEEFSTQLQQQKEDFHQQKDEFSYRLEQQKEEFSSQLQQQKTAISQLQQQKDEFSTRLQQQKEEFSSQLREQKTAISQLHKLTLTQKEECQIQLGEQKEMTFELQQQIQEQADKLQHLRKELTKHVEQQQTQEPAAPLTPETVSKSKAGNDIPKKKANVQGNFIKTSKRSDDLTPTEAVISQMSQQMTTMTSEIQVLRNVNAQQDARIGASYIRWGSTGCPSSAELVYSGIAGGTSFDKSGPANHLCLTTQPNYDNHPNPTVNFHAYIYGSEYEICPEAHCNLTPACAACRILRGTTVMIPGTTQCPQGWMSEYSGHIMGGYNTHASSEYLCVDSSLGNIEGDTNISNDQNSIFYVVSKCGALPCPPYRDEKIVTCVVCSK